MFTKLSGRHVPVADRFMFLVLLFAAFNCRFRFLLKRLADRFWIRRPEVLSGRKSGCMTVNNGEMRTTKSAEDGIYSFKGLPIGNFLLEAGNCCGNIERVQRGFSCR